MPYEGERASKISHSDIVKNPDVTRFLSQCEYLRIPDENQTKEVVKRFEVPPENHNGPLPENIIATDGSFYESSLNDKLPSTKVGYIKVSSVLIRIKEFNSLRTDGQPFVDPFKVARLEENNSPITFTLPSANIRRAGEKSVRESFRAVVDEMFADNRTRMRENDPNTSLRTTLFLLASLRPDKMGSGDISKIRLHKCPTCDFDGGGNPLEISDTVEAQYCPSCKSKLFATDCLRIWEEVTDFQSNAQALGRLMMVAEHLIPIHYIRSVAENSLQALGSMCFFVDGPLAVFGNCAWLYGSILKYLFKLNEDLGRIGQPPIIIIGLQKTGQVVDHAQLIDKYIEPNRLFPIDDEYRYKYILNGREMVDNGFGDETYYGQDFIYKTKTGRIFIFGLPFPFQSKRPLEHFLKKKTELQTYPSLGRAISLIDRFESDLYKNAVVPIALAHHYTAISLRPGGRVLDLLTRKGLETEN